MTNYRKTIIEKGLKPILSTFTPKYYYWRVAQLPDGSIVELSPAMRVEMQKMVKEGYFDEEHFTHEELEQLRIRPYQIDPSLSPSRVHQRRKRLLALRNQAKNRKIIQQGEALGDAWCGPWCKPIQLLINERGNELLASRKEKSEELLPTANNLIHQLTNSRLRMLWTG